MKKVQSESNKIDSVKPNLLGQGKVSMVKMMTMNVKASSNYAETEGG